MNSLLKKYHNDLQSLAGSSLYRSDMKKKIVNNALLTIAKIRQNMKIKINTVKKNIKNICDSLSERYPCSQKKIKQTGKHIYKDIKYIMFQLQKECRAVKKAFS